MPQTESPHSSGKDQAEGARNPYHGRCPWPSSEGLVDAEPSFLSTGWDNSDTVDTVTPVAPVGLSHSCPQW